MSLNIELNHASKVALEAEASLRQIPCEQVASEIIDSFFTIHGVCEKGYDEWFKAQVEEGLEDIKNGRVVSNEEMERTAEELMARINARKRAE